MQVGNDDVPQQSSSILMNNKWSGREGRCLKAGRKLQNRRLKFSTVNDAWSRMLSSASQNPERLLGCLVSPLTEGIPKLSVR